LTFGAWSRKIAGDDFWICESRRLEFISRGGGAIMYIHMFAFRFKNGVTSEQKNHCVTEIRKLKDEIKEVQESWVGLNISPRGQGYELGGSMKFADAAAFERYNAHPVHQKLLGWLIPLIEPIEVDFSL
jgi:hypothetical protein